MPNNAQWYQLSVEEVLNKVGSRTDGLSSGEVLERLKKYGPNEIESSKTSPLMRLLRQFHHPMVYVLLVAAVITVFLTLQGEHMLPETGVILAVVILNVVLGFVQEGKTESALEALRRMIVRECLVIRDGEQKVIQTRELVPGDVVILNSGDRVPADLRLLFTREISVDEAALTGESLPVEKNTLPITKSNLAPGDQLCMVFNGTFITRGSARGVVVATAGNTEFGKIAKLVKGTSKATSPLQRKIGQFTKTLIIAILILGGLNLLSGYLVGFSFSYSFLATIALIVAAVPEMLPMIVTSILALSASTMAKRHALIRLLPAAETLGSTTVICSDKTGTLTKNQMTVVKLYTGQKAYSVSGAGYNPYGEFTVNGEAGVSVLEDTPLFECLKAGFLCGNASLKNNQGKYDIIGDPTEGALVVAAAKAGITKKLTRLDEIPFESERMYMATLNEDEKNNSLYVKGSPEVILRMCENQLTDNGVQKLETDQILKISEGMASEGLRLIGMAYKHVPSDKRNIDHEDISKMIFLGLQGMIDPPREEVIEAISRCKGAGIRTVMITGDHARTAKTIARQLGIIDDGADTVIAGSELATMNDQELYEKVNTVSVYARVAPEHKLRICRQLQKRGQIVAMTGDGVNDAPALRAADIGIAMGITGTEVSKEAASMILTDDNFASIAAAVEEGRHAWNNLEKAILYTLPTNGGQALLVMAAIILSPFVPLFALGLPLSPIHILWVNLADSVFLTMPLMMEPKEKGLLKERPRDPGWKIANKLFYIRVGSVSIVMAATAFGLFWIFGHFAIEAESSLLIQAQTATFMAVKLLHVGYIFTARSITQSAFTFSPFSNKWIMVGVGITIVSQLVITYAPFAQAVFKTAAFPVEWWPIVILALLPCFLVTEGEKLVRRQLQKGKNQS